MRRSGRKGTMGLSILGKKAHPPMGLGTQRACGAGPTEGRIRLRTIHGWR